MDRFAYDGPSYLPLRGMKKAAEEIAPSMGRRSPRRSVAWSVDSAAFWQISSNLNPCLIRFLFFINSLKNLVFEVRLYEIRHQIFRLCVLVLDFEILASDFWISIKQTFVF